MSKSNSTVIMLAVSAVVAGVSGYIRFGGSARPVGIWIDLVFITSTAIGAALTMSLLIGRMRRMVRDGNGSDSKSRSDPSDRPGDRSGAT